MSNYRLSKESKLRLEAIAELTNIDSPTGYTQEIIETISKRLIQENIDHTVTPKGGILVTIEGKNKESHRFITAHVDTLGAIVRDIKADGRIMVDRIGGYDFSTVDGNYVTIHSSRTNNKWTGTLLKHQTSVHVYQDTNSIKATQENMEIRLDHITTTREETLALGIEIGDFISFETNTEITSEGYIKSRHLDDKVSVALMLEAIEEANAGNLSLGHTTHFYVSTNEEIGYGGNSNIAPEVEEYIAIDMGAIGDHQQTDEYSVSICVKDASGPYHLGLRNHLVTLAESRQIDYRLDIYPYYGSDASAAMRAGADVRHGLFGAGIDASHAYERTHAKSIDATYNLLKAYLISSMES